MHPKGRDRLRLSVSEKPAGELVELSNRRGCRWCGRPTGSASRTCKAPLCVMKTGARRDVDPAFGRLRPAVETFSAILNGALIGMAHHSAHKFLAERAAERAASSGRSNVVQLPRAVRCRKCHQAFEAISEVVFYKGRGYHVQCRPNPRRSPRRMAKRTFPTEVVASLAIGTQLVDRFGPLRECINFLLRTKYRDAAEVFDAGAWAEAGRRVVAQQPELAALPKYSPGEDNAAAKLYRQGYAAGAVARYGTELELEGG